MNAIAQEHNCSSIDRWTMTSTHNTLADCTGRNQYLCSCSFGVSKFACGNCCGAKCINFDLPMTSIMVSDACEQQVYEIDEVSRMKVPQTTTLA